MYYIHNCKNGAVLAETNDVARAVELARELTPDDGYDTYITDTSKGTSRIVGFGTEGIIPDAGDPTDPCTRGGSVLFGREHE